MQEGAVAWRAEETETGGVRPIGDGPFGSNGEVG
jgi:hypothetical protein